MVNNLADVLTAMRPSAKPFVDFHVCDDGKGAGPYLHYWNVAVLGPQPAQAEIDAADAAYSAGATKRNGGAKVREIAQEYLFAFIINQEFGDNTRLVAVKAKIAAWKAAHPGVIP